MTAADDIHKKFFHCFSEKIRLNVSSESSARQRIHMKNQTLFSSNDKNKQDLSQGQDSLPDSALPITYKKTLTLNLLLTPTWPPTPMPMPG